MNGTPYQPTDDFQYVDLDAFDTLVYPHVPGVPRPLYELERITVLREFCRRTGALIGVHPLITIDAEMDTYLMDSLPADLAVLSLKNLLRDTGVPLSLKNFVLTSDRKSFELQNDWQTPLDGEYLYPVVSLQVCRDAERVEEEFFNRWDEGIAGGIIERLMLSPKKGWTNPQAAPIFSQRYHNAIAEAKIAVSRDFGRFAPRIVPNGFI